MEDNIRIDVNMKNFVDLAQNRDYGGPFWIPH